MLVSQCSDERSIYLGKGATQLTMTSSERVPMVMPADHMPGPEQGHWTYKDYATLPDDRHRYEIVDGVLYMAPSPNEWHQTTTGCLFRFLSTYIEDTGLGRIYIAPFDVELNPALLISPLSNQKPFRGAVQMVVELSRDRRTPVSSV
jgi:Uma2 family endonuclease